MFQSYSPGMHFLLPLSSSLHYFRNILSEYFDQRYADQNEPFNTYFTESDDLTDLLQKTIKKGRTTVLYFGCGTSCFVPFPSVFIHPLYRLNWTVSSTPSKVRNGNRLFKSHNAAQTQPQWSPPASWLFSSFSFLFCQIVIHPFIFSLLYSPVHQMDIRDVPSQLNERFSLIIEKGFLIKLDFSSTIR